MHELGVVLNMLDTLDAAAKRYGVSRIASVSVDVGELTGIVPVSATSAESPQTRSTAAATTAWA